MDNLFFILIIFLFIMQPIKIDNNSALLEKNTSVALKGIFSIVVVLHHVAQITNDGLLFRNFIFLGRLSVAVFFLLSGYGLIQQYKKAGKTYFADFFQKKLLTIVFPYLFISFIYYIYFSMMQHSLISLSSLKEDLFYGNLLVPYSWYIVVIVIFYIGFYFIFKLVPNIHVAHIFLYFYVFSYLYLIGTYSYFGSWWFRSCLAFCFGITLGIYEKKLNSIFLKFYPTTLFLLFFSYCLMEKLATSDFSNVWRYAPLLFFNLSIGFLAVFIIYICLKINLVSKPTLSLGNHSLYIYLWQGLPISFFRSSLIYLDSDLLYCIVVLLSTLGLAYLFSTLSNLLQWKKPGKDC